MAGMRRGLGALAVVVAWIGLMAWAPPAGAAAGDLDATFSGDGRQTTNLTGGFDPGFAVDVQDDGKVVVAGRAGGAGGRMFVTRYTSTGGLDTSFSGDGKAFIDFTTGDDVAFEVVVQDDGTIVVGGVARVGPNGTMAVARLESDGTLDTSFSGDGKAMPSFSTPQEFSAELAVLDDGRIVLAGGVVAANGAILTALARLNANGTPDTSFSADGLVTANLSTGDESAQALEVLDDGRIVAVGLAEGTSAQGYRSFIARYNADGTRDTSWNGTGRSIFNQINGYEDFVAVAVQDDGKVVAAGEVEGRLSLMRFLDTGAPDTSFSGDGRQLTNLPGGYEWIAAVELQADQRIVVTGRMAGTGGRAMVARYNTDGTLDTSFSTDGFTPVDFSPAWDYAPDLALQADGAIVIAATVDNDDRAGVARILAN
jgi:uncharacterized delta-60 repeat protein